jgi:hypothetical protein
MIFEVEVPPFDSTFMGVIKGVADFYSLRHSSAMIYGASGYAFFLNIHETLCPSGPYSFNREPIYVLLANLGLQVTDLGFFSNGSTKGERDRVERTIKTSYVKSNEQILSFE